MTDTINIAAIKERLIELGCKEWNTGKNHRIYFDGIDAEKLFDNYHARFGKSHTAHFDVNTGEFFCSDKRIRENLNILAKENFYENLTTAQIFFNKGYPYKNADLQKIDFTAIGVFQDFINETTTYVFKDDSSLVLHNGTMKDK